MTSLYGTGLHATNRVAVFTGVSLSGVMSLPASPSVAIQGGKASPLLKILCVRYSGKHKLIVLYVWMMNDTLEHQSCDFSFRQWFYFIFAYSPGNPDHEILSDAPILVVVKS